MIIQDLWRTKLEWDQPVPSPWIAKWFSFRTSMQQIHQITVPRWLGCDRNHTGQLHVFTDVSCRAIVSSIYHRTIMEDGEVIINLLGAKTKLASIKGLMPPFQPRARMTIPRLELRAVLLAAQLLRSTANSLSLPLSESHEWSDSQVVLHWLHTDGPTGSNYVDNYINHIHELTPGVTWHHVPSEDNPADIASRGTDDLTLTNATLWWRGPSWLRDPPNMWPVAWLPPQQNPLTLDNEVQCSVAQVQSLDIHPIDQFSDLDRLLGATARCRRILHRKLDPKSPSPGAPVTAGELRREFIALARLSQNQDYTSELSRLRQGRSVRVTSPLRLLAPFLDDDGVLRVSGRLCHSLLSRDKKHPVILNGRSHLGQLIIEWAHRKVQHTGFRLTYHQILQRAWLVGGRAQVRAHL